MATRTQTFTVDGTLKTFTTSYTYTPREGLLKKIINPLGDSTTFDYDSRRRLSKQADARGQVAQYFYDNSDRRTRIEYSIPPAAPHKTLRFTYDGMGRLVTESDGQVSREYFRDRLGRLKEVATTLPAPPFSRSFRFDYVDDYGQLTAFRDSEGLLTSYEYDQENRVTRIQRGGTRVSGDLTGATPTARFAYDRAGRLVEWTVPDSTAPTGRIIRQYNARGQVGKQLGPLAGQEISYAYDALGRKASRTHVHLGLVTNWQYDELSRLRNEEILHNGSPRYRDQFLYDEAGNRTQRTRNGIPQTFKYNGFNQLESTTTNQLSLVSLPLTAAADASLDVGHEPDLALDTAKPTTSNTGEAFVSQTDTGEHFLALRLQQPPPPATPQTMTVYSLKLFLPGDDNGLPQDLRIQYEDPPGTWNDVQIAALQGATKNTPTAPPLFEGIRPIENTVSLSFLGVTTEAIRILQVAGAGPSTPLRHGGALAVNEVELYSATSTTTSYGYDANGNMVAAGNRAYEYDEQNRLMSVLEPSVADMTLVYGPGGRLLKEVDALAGTETNHAYLGREIYADYDSSGVLVRKYVHGPLLDQKVALENYSGGSADPLLFMWPEPNGTIHQVTDALGNVLEGRITSAWGEPLSLASLGVSLPAPPSPLTEFAYTGRRNLGNTGLMDYRARFYDPKLGRFLNPDPSGTKAGLNRYGYVNGDPINLVDRSGLGPELVDGQSPGRGVTAPPTPAPLAPTSRWWNIPQIYILHSRGNLRALKDRGFQALEAGGKGINYYFSWKRVRHNYTLGGDAAGTAVELLNGFVVQPIDKFNRGSEETYNGLKMMAEGDVERGSYHIMTGTLKTAEAEAQLGAELAAVVGVRQGLSPLLNPATVTSTRGFRLVNAQRLSTSLALRTATTARTVRVLPASGGNSAVLKNIIRSDSELLRRMPSPETVKRLETFARRTGVSYEFSPTAVTPFTDPRTGLITFPGHPRFGKLADVPLVNIVDEFGHSILVRRGLPTSNSAAHHMGIFGRASLSKTVLTRAEAELMQQAEISLRGRR